MAELELGTMSHVTLNVTDIQKSLEFYERFLGLERLFFDDLPNGMGKTAGVRTAAGVSIELLQLTGPDGKANPVNMSDQCTRVVFSVADVGAAKASLAGAGFDDVGEMEFDGIKMLFIKDPDGRTIELSQFPDNHMSVAAMYDSDAEQR